MGSSKSPQPSCLPSPRSCTCMQSVQVRCPSVAIGTMTAEGPHALPSLLVRKKVYNKECLPGLNGILVQCYR